MRHVRLVAFYDEPTGELGLGVKGVTGTGIFSAREGALLAHDILEHQNGFNAIGCPADELEALGGIWQVRGRWGTLLNDDRYWRCPAESMGEGDMVSIARDWLNMERQTWSPWLGRYRTQRHDFDEDFEIILDKARVAIPRDLDEDERETFPLDAFLDNALHLMRRGFNKARRRFGMGYEGLELFRAVKDAIDPHAKHIDYEGQEFRLSYGDGKARCSEIYPPVEAYDEW